MQYVFLFFFFFTGLGANLANLSPYVLSHFPDTAKLVFLALQISMPLGNLFAGWISDKTANIRIFSNLGLGLLVPVQFFLYRFPESAYYSAFFSFAIGFLLTANMQWISIALLEDKGENRFSRIRSAGTVGFMCIQLFLYLLADTKWGAVPGTDIGKNFGAFLYLPAFFLSFSLPKQRKSKQTFHFKDALQFIQQKFFLVFFLVSFCYYFSYQLIDNYLGKYIQISIGLQAVFFSWFVAVILEIPYLFYLPKIVEKWGNFAILYLSLISAAIRFSLLAYTVYYFSEGLLWLSQTLHSFVYVGFYMGAIYCFRQKVPHHLYGSVFGLHSIFAQSFGFAMGNLVMGTLLAKPWNQNLFHQWGILPYRVQGEKFFLLFVFAASICILLLPTIAYLKRIWHNNSSQSENI
ncbi:MAG: MFS transporter [Spirochaetota bacterium]